MGPPKYQDTIRWSFIIQLSLDIYAPCQTLLTILAQCPHLGCCLLRLTRRMDNIQPIHFLNERRSARSNTVVLPKLHTLLLMSSHHGQWVVSFDDFYNRLDTPNLVKLLLFSLQSAFSDPMSVHPGAQMHALEGFLKRCVSLTKITLHIRGLDQYQLYWILRAASSVTELILDTQERMTHNKPAMLPPTHFVLKALLMNLGRVRQRKVVSLSRSLAYSKSMA
ncbi:hypothetical protein BJ165DRAFT_261199 [Panaeolus papilionaceus]|nr:hypothetical protein BJ165DRAFT_261199 [Panaeolus papilionaceus]